MSKEWGSSMKDGSIYRTLIEAIEKLYLRIVVKALHRRMGAYHKEVPQQFKPYQKDIKTPLLVCIDDIIENGPDDDECVPIIHYAIPTNASMSHQRPGAGYIHVQHAIDKKNVGELSRYFKARWNGSDIHPGIKEKLERSAWEHLHASIRHARQGENETARIHADIAHYACNELAHYLSEKDYQCFTSELEKHLGTLQSEEQGA